MAAIAPASPLPVPKPPAELIACIAPTIKLVSPKAAATMGALMELPERRDRIRAHTPQTIPIKPNAAAAVGKSRPVPIPAMAVS